MLIGVASNDVKFRAQLVALLSTGGHRAAELSLDLAGVGALRATKPHMLVVAGGSDRDATKFLEALRAQADLRRLPVLCVDPKAEAGVAVGLLDAGADDAITRPFQPPIFLARVRTLLRRVVWSGDAPEEVVTILTGGPIELQLVSRQAAVSGKRVELTRLEFDLLAHLLKHPDRAFRREELLAAIWNYPGSVETRTLDKHVESLRRKVGASASLIHTVHGVGYRFTPAVASKG